MHTVVPSTTSNVMSVRGGAYLVFCFSVLLKCQACMYRCGSVAGANAGGSHD